MVYRQKSKPFICSNCGKPALFTYKRWTRSSKEGKKHYYWYTAHFDSRKFKKEQRIQWKRKSKPKGYTWCRNMTDKEGYIDPNLDVRKRRK